MKRTVRSNIGEVTVRELGMVYARVFPNSDIDLQHAIEYHSMVKYLTRGNSHSSVIDISGIRYISKEAREHLKTISSKWGKTVSVALITNSFTAKMIGNFFLTTNKPDYPVKIFTDQLLAKHWAKNEYLKFITRKAS